MKRKRETVVFLNHFSNTTQLYSRYLTCQRLFTFLGTIGELEKQLAKLRAGSYAKSTQRTRMNQWAKFESFCLLHKLIRLPASEKTVCLYIAYLARSLEYTTINNYVASVASYHHYNDFETPNMNHYSIKQALAGVMRSRRELPNQRNAVTLELLAAIKDELIVIPDPVRETFWAACLVAFFSLLRSSNLFYNGKTGAPASVTMKCLRFKAAVTFLKVPVLKTNRFLKVLVTTPIPYIPGSCFCPTTALKNMISKVRPADADPVFSYRQSGRVLGISGRLFNNYLKRVLASIGLKTRNWSAHSFRRGGTTFAASLGLSDAAIKAQGNSRSSCFERYVSLDSSLKLQFASKLKEHLSLTAASSARDLLGFGG